MRILLVESDPIAARHIGLIFRSDGSAVEHTDTGEEALDLARRYDFDAAVLELMLPDIDGYEVIRRLRSARLNIPVLILSDRGNPQAKVKGFTAGADDFITKPFNKAELLARVQAVVRRSRGHSHPSLRVGPLQLDLNSREVMVNGKEVRLTRKEYATLKLLALRKGMVLTKEAFFNDLYGGRDEPDSKTVDAFIAKLRKKLAQAGVSNLIATVRGRGYMIREWTENDLRCAPAGATGDYSGRAKMGPAT